MSAATGLQVPQEMADAILAQARAEYPNEACGVIIGRNGIAERLKPMFNAAASPTFYEFDPKDLLALYREVDDNDEEIIVIYHSHTATEAYPSRTDIAYAAEPFAHYVLISTRETGNDEGPYELRSYRIVEEVITEEEKRKTRGARIQKKVS